MNKKLTEKLAKLPKKPGVYFHKNLDGQIIYIGKAAVLKNRVKQYFQNSRTRDPKTELLIAEIADIDWIEVETEIDALFLEAELVRRYLPKYNILLRDDKSLIYIRIDYKSSHPTISYTRRPLDDGAEYYGPYFNTTSLKRAMNYLRRVFPYSTHTGIKPKRVCLQYHLGLCPGIEEGKTPLKDYRANLRKLTQYLKGNRIKLISDIEKEMKIVAKDQNFELAAKYRNQLRALKSLSSRIVFSDKEIADINKDAGLYDLSKILGLGSVPKKIEGYDISHMQGSNNVASMVVFVNGAPDKASYRKFKLRIPGNNDYAHIEEVVTRRLKHQSKWVLPDLMLIDGGKGQLASAIKASSNLGIKLPMIGLAKREEEIIVDLESSNVNVDFARIKELDARIKTTNNFVSILLPSNTPVIKLLQRIRDESHRFAVSYHSVLKVKGQKNSVLDNLPGIGPVTKRKLLKSFGSLDGITKAKEIEIQKVVGKSKGKIISLHLWRSVKS